MKKITLLTLIFAACILPLAANTTVSENNNTDNSEHTSLVKLTMQMQRLQREGQLLEAIDTATLILTYDSNHRQAADFLHRHWDKTMQLTQQQLTTLSDEYDLQQAEQRCQIYRLLDQIHLNLRSVSLPLYGPNQKWVWQPEVAYYAGHYDSERIKTFGLLLLRANQALKNFDTQTAQIYFQTALNQYLLTENERNSNRQQITDQCNRLIARYANSKQVYQAIFAYDLCQLSLQIDNKQTYIQQLQTQIQEHVAQLYLTQAQEALQAGDTIQAYELNLSYQDWKTNNNEQNNEETNH